MISRKNRFHGHNSLNYVYRTGKTVRSEMISLKYCDVKNEDYRLAVIVSKKVTKSAVKRNRIRRRIFEIVRLSRKNQPNGKWSKDLAITVFDERVGTMPSDELTKKVNSLLKKSGAI